MELRFRPWTAAAVGRHQSLWMELALAATTSAETQQLTGTVGADVCIVGGGPRASGRRSGYTSRSLEFRSCCLSPTSAARARAARNSGGVGHLWSKLPTLTRLLGADDGLQLIRENIKAISDIQETCERYGIDCDLEAMESTWTATSRAQMGAWNGVLACARELGVEDPYRELDQNELRELFGAGPYYGGVIQGGC